MVQSPSQPASSRFPAPSARIVGALAAALYLAPACQRADSSAPATQDPRLGHARVAARISAQRSQGSATAVCAQWTLTPFSIDAAGGQTQAGDPVTFTSTSAAAGTAFIAGCLDAGAGGPNPDWGYWVTASHFDDCAGNPVPGLAPAIATSEVTFDCVAGEDQPIGVSVDVSIATPDDTGYIDIGLGVNSASVPVSCKQADGSETGGPLHFGDAALVGPDAPIPPAYTALGVLSPGSAAATPASDLSLFASATTGSDGSYGFVNGLVDLPPAPQTLTVVQTFQPKDACAANQMTVELAAPACVTTATSGTPAHTQAGLADLFASWPGLGAVTAFISGSQLTLYTSLGGPRWTTVQPASTDHDDLSQAQTLTLPGPVLGVWPDQQAGGQLDALVQTSGGPALAVLSLNTGSGAWVAGALQALPSQANLQAMGLFAHSGCYALPPPPAGGACLPGADYSVRNQIYFQMEPDQVQLPGWTVDLDNEATGCQAGGVCAGDLFGNWSHRTFVYQPSGGAVGGYFSFPQNAQGDINGTLAHAALTGAHAATVEFLFRPSDFSYNGASTILGLWGSSDKSRVRFDAANAAVVIEMGAAYTHLNAAGAPTAVTTSITATFGLWGPASSSWQHVTDGQFHHFAITFDLDAGKGQLFVDGATDARWLLPLSGMPPAGSSNTALLGGNVFTMSTNFWNEDLTGDLDEVAVSEGVLPQALLAQHAQEAAAGQHYTFVESCQAPTPEALTWDNSPLLTDFVPTGTGQLPQDPWQVPGTANVPAQDEAQQLSDWPAPRYLAGHTVPRMEHWVDPTYYGWLPPGTLTGPQRTALQNAATAEEMRTWNYYGPATYGTRALSADPTLPRALAWHEFWGGPTDTSLPFPSSAYFADHSLKHDEGLAAARAAGAAKAHLIEASLAGAGLLPADVQLYITEDGEVANPAIASHTQYSCPTLATSPSDWAAYTAELCYGGACDPATVDCANHPSTSGYGAWFHAQLRLAYADGYRDVLGPNIAFDWYHLDGNPSYNRPLWQGSGPDTTGAARLIDEAQPGQLFQPPGAVQHLSSADQYFVSPSRWAWLSRADNNGTDWLTTARYHEEQAGDFLFGPFFSAGWAEDYVNSVIRPSQALALLKYYVTTGAITFHPGVFSTAIGGVTPVPGDAREYLWQLGAASYAQALASQVEPLMRASREVFEQDGVHTPYPYPNIPGPRHYTRNPNELVGVRRAYDASDAPQPVYLISAGLMGFTNGVTGAWDRSADVEFTLDQSVTPPQRVKLRARRQGALYKLDLSGGAPVLVQYDGWHEDAHFSWWQKEFAFSAPVAESTSGSADGSATLAARTEAPNLSMANLDFSNFTSFLSVSGGSATWADEAAHAPSALYRFMPRPAWPSDWSLAVRARANGGAGQVYASVDAPLGQAGTRALPVSAAGWTWICADAGGQPLTFTGLATGATHELRLAPSNSSVEIADVKLVSHAPGAGCQ